MSYQPGDPEGAVRLAVQASRALAAAGQSDMVWGHARQRLPVLLNRCRIADDKNFRMASHAAIRLHLDAPGAIGLHTQPFSRRGRRDSGGPDHCLACDSLASHDHTLVVNFINAVAQAHLNTQFLQVFLRGLRKVLGKCAQHPIGHVHENDAS